ncbi:MAG TPA: hypothetical protein VFV98_18210 [Vicinamibacterales bacterium]|nr:hypothetical protein [Vicinamibacterales bacterium]
MKVRIGAAITLAAAMLVARSSSTGAQKAQEPAPAGGHKHYETPADFQNKPGPNGELAPRLQNLGTHIFTVTTKNPRAQLFINQGVNLAWAFNHAESGRAFREAARLDPNLAMAYWGQALVLGPNINAAMDPNDEGPAHQAIQKAIALKPHASLKERALIDALALRYSGKADDRISRDAAYAAAMKKVQAQYPNDLDIAALYVESLMDLRPWGYWMDDGRPYEGVAEAVSLIEKTIARNPKHPGALHLYIHLVEAHHPQKAEAAADRLLPLMPAAGHMVHMPAHIYQRVGRYADAIKSNQLAIAADEDYITQCRAQGLYPLGYYPHNLHFLWFAATFDGQSRLAIESARKTASKIDAEVLQQMPMMAAFKVVPYYALTRFGNWDEMLKEPAPPAGNAYLTGIYHYARGIALVGKGQLADAEKELAAVTALVGDKSLDAPLFSPNTAAAVFAIAPEVLAAEIAAARKQYDVAIGRLERAVRLEDGLVYTEPSEWHYPPRHALGAVLLAAGRAKEAETVYWEDLRSHPDNGWALFGVSQALRAQKKDAQADVIDARLKKAWARADFKLTGSKF